MTLIIRENNLPLDSGYVFYSESENRLGEPAMRVPIILEISELLLRRLAPPLDSFFSNLRLISTQISFKHHLLIPNLAHFSAAEQLSYVIEILFSMERRRNAWCEIFAFLGRIIVRRHIWQVVVRIKRKRVMELPFRSRRG